MTRKITITIISVIFCAAVALTLWILCRDVDLQSEFSIDNHTDGISSLAFPLKGSGGVAELAPNLRFRFSSASTVSSINPSTLAYLREKGYSVDSVSSCFFARDAKGNLSFVDQVYIVDFPLHNYTFSIDTALRRYSSVADPNPAKIVRRAKFVKAPEGTDNIIGSDIMSMYVMEYKYSHRSVRFHKRVPENYDSIGSIHKGSGPLEWLGTGHRWFVDISVDHNPHTFLINTSLRGVNMKMPLSDSPEDKDSHNMVNMVYPSRDFSNYYEGMIDPDAWIIYGTRTGTRQIYYFDSHGARYQMNPMIFFKQDVVFDFINGHYYLHPQKEDY